MVKHCDWQQVGLTCDCVCVSAVNIGNSQEWSLSRSITELRLVSCTTLSPLPAQTFVVLLSSDFLLPHPPQGILGSVKSGRSALVHKYVTGSYVAVEKPDGEELQSAVS